MPKEFIKKYLPHPEKIKEHKLLKHFNKWLSDPNLWHLNRYSVAMGSFIGVFCALLPIPLQLIPAVALCIVLRANVLLAIVLVWLTNPITYVPIFYLTYQIGALILGETEVATSIDFSSEWLFSHIKPLFVGSILTGLSLGSISYAAIQIIWRRHVMMRWHKRKEKRDLEKAKQ